MTVMQSQTNNMKKNYDKNITKIKGDCGAK